MHNNIRSKRSATGKVRSVNEAAEQRHGKKRKKNGRSLKGRSSPLKKKAVTVGLMAGMTGLLVWFFLFSCLKDHMPYEQQRACALLENANTKLESLDVSENMKKNAVLIITFSELIHQLDSVSSQFERESNEAAELSKRLKHVVSKLGEKNSVLKDTRKFEDTYRVIINAFDNGNLSNEQAIEKIERLIVLTPAAPNNDAAHAKILEIKTLIREMDVPAGEKERKQIAESIAEAKGFVSSGEFKEAVSVLESALQKEYAIVSGGYLEMLHKQKENVVHSAVRFFSGFVEETIEKVRTGDHETLKSSLTREYERISLPEIDELYREGLSCIESIEAKRREERNAALKAGLETIEKFVKKRMYGEAAELYSELIPLIGDRKQKDKAVREKLKWEIYAYGKEKLIGYVNETEGIPIIGLGIIKRLSQEKVELQIGNMSLPVGWEKIKKTEFMALVRKVIETKRDDDLNLLFATFIAENRKKGVGQKKEEDEIQNEYSGKYPSAIGRKLTRARSSYQKGLHHIKAAVSIGPSSQANSEFKKAETLLRKALSIYVSVFIQCDDTEINEMIIKTQEQLYSVIKLNTAG